MTYTITSLFDQDFYIGKDDIGVYAIDNHVTHCLHKYPNVQRCDADFTTITDALRQYSQGLCKTLDFPLHLQGTPFQQQVWQALLTIPYGKTVSYATIASMIEKPTAVRAVGSAISKNPVMFSVPCHRVIGKDGSLTGFSGGIDLKKQLLNLEGGNNNAA